MTQYTHLNFSVDPESVGKELRDALACLMCNGKVLCQRSGQYPCDECLDIATNLQLLKVLARTLLKAARYGREENTLEVFRAAGHAAEYLIEQAELPESERERSTSKTVVSFERAVKAAIADISDEQLAQLQEQIVVTDSVTLPQLRNRLAALLLGDGA